MARPAYWSPEASLELVPGPMQAQLARIAGATREGAGMAESPPTPDTAETMAQIAAFRAEECDPGQSWVAFGARKASLMVEGGRLQAGLQDFGRLLREADELRRADFQVRDFKSGRVPKVSGHGAKQASTSTKANI